MLRESQLALLPMPSVNVTKALKVKYIMKTPDGKTYPTLGGSCVDLLEHETDLVSLKQPEHADRLTIFVQEHLSFLFRVMNPLQIGV